MLTREKLLLASLSLALLTAPAHANLIITPTFDSSITSDPNSATIQATINAAINIYENLFSDPINVTIEFQEMGGGLGQSNTTIYNIDYTTFYNALVLDAKSSDDTTALAHLPPVNPVATSSINIKTANIRALGINCPSCTSTLPGGFDGIIGLNTSITNLNRTGAQDPNKYDLRAVAMHEIDEVLGLGSALPSPFLGSPSPEDLFRYDGSGARSFTSDTSKRAFFSIDGTTDLAEFNNQISGSDFGDWRNGVAPPQVQDASGSPGSQPNLGVEIRALDVIGYDLAAPEPATWALMIAAFALIGVVKHKKLGIHST